MSDTNKKVVTRFAPSPTGFMHVGGVRTALYAWAWAKKNDGTFILRIEDTDKAREVEGSIAHIMESLKWLGIEWDQGPDIGGSHAPYLQSERLESYKKYANILIEKGLAYPDPYTKEEIESFRKNAEDEKKVFLFRDHRPEKFGVWNGTQPLRFKVPVVKSYTWMDEVRGELSAGPEALDDFILIKSDGYPTYNFAHIIDDLEMGVTHIMRADEFIASTPKFLSLYEALEIIPPVLVTLPPILGKEGTKKLGKRDGAKDILEYRNDGFLADAMVNFLAFLGWNPGDERDVMTPLEIIESFDISRIHKSGAMLDEEKLLWLNKEHLKRQSDEVKLNEVKKHLPDYPEDLLKRLLPSIIDRISVYSQIDHIESTEFRFFIDSPEVDIEKIIWKDETKDQAAIHLEEVKRLIESGDLSSVENVNKLIMPYAEVQGKGSVLWPLRYSLSGQEKSIDPFTLVYILGKEESIKRIEKVLEKLT
ncbi:MAG: gltX [Candidatus Nomurabacteria bacterium]|nr:gltX [Candidatus Nomurabacteria bacterium]